MALLVHLTLSDRYTSVPPSQIGLHCVSDTAVVWQQLHQCDTNLTLMFKERWGAFKFGIAGLLYNDKMRCSVSMCLGLERFKKTHPALLCWVLLKRFICRINGPSDITVLWTGHLSSTLPGFLLYGDSSSKSAAIKSLGSSNTSPESVLYWLASPSLSSKGSVSHVDSDAKLGDGEDWLVWNTSAPLHLSKTPWY